MTYQTAPKLELHLHHEGAAPPKFIAGLAAEKNIDISRIFDANGNYSYRGFEEFLKVYEAACEPLQSPHDFYRLTRAILSECADNGVIYAETFISPDFCGGGDLVAWRDYLAAIQAAATEMEAERDIILRGIVTCIRHLGPEEARKSAQCAAETVGDFIRGFGMGGAEMMHQPADFAYSFDMAREAGLGLTCHAGEWGGAKMVADTIRDLRVDRIGHGIGAIDDQKLIAEIVDKDIMLEVCPGSNVVLGAVPDWPSHPIKRLRDAGVPVTVSTDDPPFFDTTMTKEYDMLDQVFGFGDDDFRALQNTALKHAYCDNETRENLAKRLEQAND